MKYQDSQLFYCIYCTTYHLCVCFCNDQGHIYPDEKARLAQEVD